VIILAIGANLPSPFGSPRQTVERALDALAAAGLTLLARSRWYESAPVPPSDQPWYVNGVVALATERSPGELMALLHGIEASFGRIRRQRNEARVLDLDLIAYDELVLSGPQSPILPHPRMHERAFVLLPLAELAPEWRHPKSGEPIKALIERLDPALVIRPLGELGADPARP
jgi:2-amino-4-hydroxy-6-hydroxymethyldihydropteridine diphosphokinase